MSKSRYTNAKIIKVADGKKAYSLHGTVKDIDVSRMSLVPIKVDENTRLDAVAAKYLGSGKHWWVIAYINNLFWPWNISKGSTLLVPENVDEALDYF